MPYFPFHVRDWLASSSAQALTYAEKGVYVDLLAKMWEQAPTHGDCSLLDDDRFLARTLHLTPDEWQEFRSVLVDGPGAVLRAEDGRVFNARQRRDWEAACLKSRKAAESVGVRWAKDRNTFVDQSNNERSPDVIPPIDADTDPDSVPPDSVANATPSSGTVGSAPSAPAAKVVRGSASKPPDPRVKPVLEHFGDRFRDELGSTYPAAFARDGQQIRRLPAEYDAAALCRLIDEFFACDDREVRQANPTVANFVRLVPKLVRLSGNGLARASPGADPISETRERLRREGRLP